MEHAIAQQNKFSQCCMGELNRYPVAIFKRASKVQLNALSEK